MFPFNLFKNEQKEEKRREQLISHSNELIAVVQSFAGFRESTRDECLEIISRLRDNKTDEFFLSPEFEKLLSAKCYAIRGEREAEEKAAAEKKTKELADLEIKVQEANAALTPLLTCFRAITELKVSHPHMTTPSCVLQNIQTGLLYDFEYENDEDTKRIKLTQILHKTRMFPV